MSPRKVAEKLRKMWGKALYMAPNRPGGSTSASSATNTFSSAMSRLTVARIPIGSQSPGNDTPGASLGIWRYRVRLIQGSSPSRIAGVALCGAHPREGGERLADYGDLALKRLWWAMVLLRSSRAERRNLSSVIPGQPKGLNPAKRW